MCKLLLLVFGGQLHLIINIYIIYDAKKQHLGRESATASSNDAAESN
jgi:hypothetical protein